MNQTSSVLKTLLVRARKHDLILKARLMSGLKEVESWERTDHLELHVVHKARFRSLASQHKLKVWELQGHWMGVVEAGSVPLLRSVLATLYDVYPTWQQDQVGTQLAYLAMAVVERGKLDFDKTIPWSAAFAETLVRHFPPQHPVWPFISLSDPNHGYPFNH